MKYWTQTDNGYELHMESYYEDTIILKFFQSTECEKEFIYTSDILRVEYDLIYCDNIVEAKEEFEDLIRWHFEDNITYYKECLKQFE